MHEKARLTLHENVLTTDEAIILEDGYYYKGHNKAQVKLCIYHYANEWSDREEARYFRTLENALDYYKKHYKERVLEQGKAWLEEDEQDDLTDEACESEWDTLTYYCEY